MKSRKELKKNARRNLKHHYPIFVVACVIAAFIGTEFTSTFNISENKILPETTIKESEKVDQAVKDALKGETEKSKKATKEIKEEIIEKDKKNQMQPVRYKLVCDPETREKVFGCIGWAGYLKDWEGPQQGERPAVYIFLTTPEKTNAQCDEGIIGQTILLAACEMGMGGCFLGNLKRERLSEILSLPGDRKIDYCIALGYPKETVVLEEIPAGGAIEYYRDSRQVHHVPKIRTEDLILE